ncbi:Histidine kinase [Lentzea fradiae]|uniref:histidine kinase n=1 Tax=Lentzea fradiae TaxID=200378 RepID=A0A1G7SGG4_9PSEU|nr:histidine kinase [Lentzea fradiae]SDG21994.1 Histidine kinase [Lentzea fradiae]
MTRAEDLGPVLLVAALESWRDLPLWPFAVAALTALYLHTRHRLARARAEQEERERDLRAERARTEERTRLASELHDVVTYRLNLMVLHAGALRMAAKDTQVRDASEELRTTGRQALAEMRDLISVLRSGRTTRIPDVLPDRLSSLVADSGLEITLVEHGNTDIISPAVRRTMYRVVQESLTNVHKHAPGAQTEITVHCGPNVVRAVIRNTAPPSAPDTRPAPGTGLLGLRGRVEVVGGTLTAGPTDDGGFEVNATLPASVPT